MRMDKLTSKFQMALADAQSLALGQDNQFIEPVHLLVALLDQEGGSIRHLLTRAGVNVNGLRSQLGERLDGMPKVSGAAGEVNLSNDTIKLLNIMDKLAQDRGDAYIASELFVPRLPEFMAQHPDLEISVDTSDESPEKHPMNADASIRIFRSAPQSFSHDRLFQLRLTPAGSPDFYDGVRVKAGRIVSNFPLVLHESRTKAWRQWERASRIKVPDHNNSIRLDSMIAVARAAERGMGAALVPKQLSNAWFEAGSLVPLGPSRLPGLVPALPAFCAPLASAFTPFCLAHGEAPLLAV